MKSYPSIPRKIQRTKVWAFDKLDGSNIRAEWSRKKGFYKFGSRRRLIDRTSTILGESVNLISECEERLSSIFTKQRWERVVAFFEFHGENSFAGFHQNEEHFVTLIDVNVYKYGMVDPERFVDLFHTVDIPKLLHEGLVDEQLITSVKQGTLDGMTFEGIVCKYTQKRHIRMFKVKSNDWITKLKEKCEGNDALFRKLV